MSYNTRIISVISELFPCPLSLPWRCAKGSKQSLAHVEQQHKRVFPCEDDVNNRKHNEGMNSQPHQYTEDVPTEACKFSHWIIHRDDLRGHQEYDTEGGVPEIEKDNGFDWHTLFLMTEYLTME